MELPIRILHTPINEIQPAIKIETVPTVRETDSTLNGGVKPQILSQEEIDSVFDEIPLGSKIAFISYSWEDDDHKDWVRKLAEDLIHNGIYVLFGQYLIDGYPLIHL